MAGVTPYSSLFPGITQNTAIANERTSTAPGSESTAENPEKSSHVSTLARQLSEAAERAEARDASMDRKAQGQRASALLSEITGQGYSNNRARYDTEVPDTDDPELLARAKQATEFVNGRGSNPFSGLSRDQLTLIIYDDSGTFTANERRAAWLEDRAQETAWKKAVVARGKLEYSQTGKMTEFFKECLAYYNGLPSIVQAQYPDFYAPRLEHLIKLDFNFRAHRAEGRGSPMDIIEILKLDEDFAQVAERLRDSLSLGR